MNKRALWGLAGSALLCSIGHTQIVRPQGNAIEIVVGPPAAVPVGPAMDVVLAGANVRFQWQPGAGQTAPVRYEVCVREVNRPCTDPSSAIYRPTGELLTEATLQRPIRPPRPGEPGFGLPTGGAGAAAPTYFLPAALPSHLKGKVLQWSIATCVPDTRPVRIGTAPGELCTSSASRNILWPPSPPTLASPAPNSVLMTITDRFSWNADPQGVEYFLICFSARGMPCPSVPAAQPFVFTARIENVPGIPAQFTPAQGIFAMFMGEALQWSVAACNAALGCNYQPVRSGFRVPVVEGSWDSIYEVTQDAKCRNCHQMFAENEVYRRHVDQGRFTRAQNPPGTAPYVSVCESCHTQATGFADAWRSPGPDANFDVARTDRHLCQVLSSDREASLTGPTGAPHVLRDHLIRWSVDRIPNLGYEGWARRFSKWTAARRPCCSNPGPRGCGNEPPHGQFIP